MFRFHPPSSSNIGPRVFATCKRCRSLKRGARAVRPIGILFSPAKPGMFNAGQCMIVHVEQKDYILSMLVLGSRTSGMAD